MKKQYEASVIVPAYNEEKNIQDVVRRIRRASKSYEIIVVDDGSTDRTADIAEKEKAIVIRLGKNMGKGFACRKGAERARSDKIVFIDGDLQLMPEEIPRLVDALDGCDIAAGTRKREDIPAKRRIANALAAKLVSRIADRRYEDALCGFRAARKKAFFSLGLKKRGYEFESEMLIAAARTGAKVQTLPVSVRYAGGKGMGAADGIKVFLFLLRNLL